MTAAANRILSEWWRGLLSVLLGVVATVVLVAALTILDHVVLPDDSMMTLDEKVPAFRVVTWPGHLWGSVSNDFAFVLAATLLTYLTIFSLAAYVVIRRLGRPPRLS